jgi:hypothetical protein
MQNIRGSELPETSGRMKPPVHCLLTIKSTHEEIAFSAARPEKAQRVIIGVSAFRIDYLVQTWSLDYLE